MCEPAPSFADAMASCEGPEKEATKQLPWQALFDELNQSKGNPVSVMLITNGC